MSVYICYFLYKVTGVVEFGPIKTPITYDKKDLDI